jgi:Mn-dependent DtxR family transcriptional regulator
MILSKQNFSPSERIMNYLIDCPNAKRKDVQRILQMNGTSFSVAISKLKKKDLIREQEGRLYR